MRRIGWGTPSRVGATLGLAVLLYSSPDVARAEVALPAVLSDGMVLQRDQRVPVWGTASAGEAVRVEFNGQTLATTADAGGRWRVDLESMKANATPATLSVAGPGNQLVVKDVLVGEVWLCSGQSNMVLPLANSADGPAAVAAATYPDVRLFNVPRRLAEASGRDVIAKWTPCSPETAHVFSAVGYYFGRQLHEELGVPVGLMFSAWGGTPAESWTPRVAVEVTPALKSVIEQTDAAVARRPAVQAEYDAAIEQWKAELLAAKAQGKPAPRAPRIPVTLARQRDAGALYDSMIAPLVPFGIRGVIWYQGEANAARASQYRTLLATLIRSWRASWSGTSPGPQFPFGVVQLPNFHAQTDEPDDSDWSHLRDAQRRVAGEVPNVALVVTIDVGEAKDIHPRNKKAVGERLARWAIADVYGRGGAWSGPSFRSVSFDGRRAKVTFDHAADAGLKLRGDAREIHEFTLAGEDRVWHRADAKIEGTNEVVVWSDKVPTPRAGRYAWDANPKDPNLTNATGLPAGPFRSDDWPAPVKEK